MVPLPFSSEHQQVLSFLQFSFFLQILGLESVVAAQIHDSNRLVVGQSQNSELAVDGS